MGGAGLPGYLRHPGRIRGMVGLPSPGSTAPTSLRKVTHRHLLIPSGVLLAIVVSFFLWGDLTDSVIYYLTPSEAVDQRADRPDGYRFRLGGLVEQDGISASDTETGFIVSDGAASVQVVHTGAVPQLFRAGIGVVVEGAWDGGVFRSDTLLINHDEQYRTAEDDQPYQIPTP
ncbi:MAG: cytochrome c maturation protein CcmE [Acidimicrobiia bacterium]|nr:cytochrome c maturation protein CcmE [Acidimicrobiia bacterium]MYH56148.1 cytochrome c maturation protein CcmE [Acidimicrobiia bacterium]